MRYLRVMVLLLAAMTACSNDNDGKEKAETASERLGHEAARQISATLQKAENVRTLQEQHAKQIEEQGGVQDSGGN